MVEPLGAADLGVDEILGLQIGRGGWKRFAPEDRVIEDLGLLTGPHLNITEQRLPARKILSEGEGAREPRAGLPPST